MSDLEIQRAIRILERFQSELSAEQIFRIRRLTDAGRERVMASLAGALGDRVYDDPAVNLTAAQIDELTLAWVEQHCDEDRIWSTYVGPALDDMQREFNAWVTEFTGSGDEPTQTCDRCGYEAPADFFISGTCLACLYPGQYERGQPDRADDEVGQLECSECPRTSTIRVDGELYCERHRPRA